MLGFTPALSDSAPVLYLSSQHLPTDQLLGAASTNPANKIDSLSSHGAYRLLRVFKQCGAKLTRHTVPAPGLYFLADLKTQPSISDNVHFLHSCRTISFYLQHPAAWQHALWTVGVHRARKGQRPTWGMARAGDRENAMDRSLVELAFSFQSTLGPHSSKQPTGVTSSFYYKPRPHGNGNGVTSTEANFTLSLHFAI